MTGTKQRAIARFKCIFSMWSIISKCLEKSLPHLSQENTFSWRLQDNHCRSKFHYRARSEAAGWGFGQNLMRLGRAQGFALSLLSSNSQHCHSFALSSFSSTQMTFSVPSSSFPLFAVWSAEKIDAYLQCVFEDSAHLCFCNRIAHTCVGHIPPLLQQ